MLLVDTSFAEPYKSWAQIASNISSVGLILGGLIWFLGSRKYRRRIQFDLDCHVYELDNESDKMVAEVELIFENKGFIDHHIRDLTVSIHSLSPQAPFEVNDKTGELDFPDVLLKRTPIVPPKYEFYFIRPGVRQVITHIVPIIGRSSMIRITAGFNYDRHGNYPHTVRRVFPVTPSKEESNN